VGTKVVVKVYKCRRKRLRKPSPITYLRGVFDSSMKTINLAWILPTTRADGTALAVADIAYVLVEMGVVPPAGTDVAYAELAKTLDTALVVPDVESGQYSFRFTVVDKQVPAKSSAPVLVNVDVPVPELAAPGEVTGVTVTLS
jgi:hypothetical protein